MALDNETLGSLRIDRTSMADDGGSGKKIVIWSLVGVVAIAAAVLSPNLALVTDVPNLLIDGAPVRRIKVEAAADFRDHGATGGMRKKLRAACEAVEHGVKRVVIGNAMASELLSGRSGTVIVV